MQEMVCKMVYIPSAEMLEKYARVLVRFALNSGNGIKHGDVVLLQVPECAKLMLIPLQREVLKAGGHYITQYLPDEVDRNFYEYAEDHHLDFFPEKLLRGRIDEIDHSIAILADANKTELQGIDPKKIMRKSKAHKPYFDWRNEKEGRGKFTWTLALYGTEAMAKEAGCSLEEYWKQIISACYLNEQDPLEHWRKSFAEVDRVKDELNKMEIEKVRIVSRNTDLIVGIGKNRKWMGGSGRNIPSFELFISPDCRMTEGKIEFDQPLYRYGNIIENVKLEFKNGRVVSASASSGEEVLKEMLATENADKIGEFSLTDVRLSKINRFMAETLFDENFGGKYGNTHIALGAAYKDSFPGDIGKVKKEEWEEMGYNDSVVHTDIVSSENREITAYLSDGSQKIIYRDGKFLL
ncbi:MAG: aminopeptidase [Nanoarchaeota archaeon]